MIYTVDLATADNVQQAVTSAATYGSSSLLGFNEPPEESVDQVLEAWPTLVNSGLRLGSPSQGPEFQRVFLPGAAKLGYPVDFLQVHYYPYVTGSASQQRFRCT